METKTLSLKDIVENNLTDSQVWKPMKSVNCSNIFLWQKILKLLEKMTLKQVHATSLLK